MSRPIGTADELERRVAAIMIAHKISRKDLEGRLFLEDCDGHGLTLAAPLTSAGVHIANELRARDAGLRADTVVSAGV
jgi:hypothetical protein